MENNLSIYDIVYPQVQQYAFWAGLQSHAHHTPESDIKLNNNVTFNDDYLIINEQFNSILETYHLTPQIFSKSCFISGGLLSSLVSVPDPFTINTNPELIKSDIDIYILGTKEKKQQCVNNIIKYLNRNSTKKQSQIKIIGATGSVIYIITDYEPRIFQLILMAETYRTPQSVIEEFDLDYVKMFYTGTELHIYKSAVHALCTKETNYTANQIHKIPKLTKVLTRCMKAITRGYKISKESINSIRFNDIIIDDESNEFITKYVTEDETRDDNQVKYMFNDTINLTLEELLTIPILKKKYETKYMSWQDISTDVNYMANGKLNMISVNKYYKNEYGIKTLMNVNSHHILKKNKDNINIVSEIDKTLNINWFGLTRTAYYDNANKPKNSIDAESIGKSILDTPDLTHDLKITPELNLRNASFLLYTSDYIDVCFHGYVIPCNYNQFVEGRLNLLLSHNSYAYLHALHETYISYVNNNLLKNSIKKTIDTTYIYTKRLLVIDPVTSADLKYYTNTEDIDTCDIGKQKQIKHIKKFMSKVKYFSHCKIHVKLRFTLTKNRSGHHVSNGSIINTKKPITYDVLPSEQHNELVKYSDTELENIKHSKVDKLFTNNGYNIYDLTGKIPTNNISDNYIKQFPDDTELESWITEEAFYKNYMDLQKHAYDIDECNSRNEPRKPEMKVIHETNTLNFINNISQTVTYDTTDDILLIIEFKKPPVHIRNDFSFSLNFYNYINLRSFKKQNGYDELLLRKTFKDLYPKRHQPETKGLLGELTDESYNKLQNLIKKLNPQGYNTELYNELYELYNLHDKFPDKKNLMFLNVDTWGRNNSNFEHVSVNSVSSSYATKYAVKMCIRSVFCKYESIYKHMYNIKLPFLYQQKGYFKNIEFTEQQINLLNTYNVSYASKANADYIPKESNISQKYIDLVNNPPSELNYDFVNDILPCFKKYVRWDSNTFKLLDAYIQISVPNKSLHPSDYKKKFNNYIMPYIIINLNNTTDSKKYTGGYIDFEKLKLTKKIHESHAISYDKYIQENITNYHDYVTNTNYELLSEYMPYELIDIVNNYSINNKHCIIHIYETL